MNREDFAAEVANDTSVDYATVQKVFNSIDTITKNYLGSATEDEKMQIEMFDGYYIVSEYRPVYTGTEYRFEPYIVLYSEVRRETNNDITRIARQNNS